jgi:ATP-dependent HslUV protease ATP-binding subunit HslU
MEKLLDDVSFDAPEMKEKKVVITKEYVRERLGEFLEREDLSRYIL